MYTVKTIETTKYRRVPLDYWYKLQGVEKNGSSMDPIESAVEQFSVF